MQRVFVFNFTTRELNFWDTHGSTDKPTWDAVIMAAPKWKPSHDVGYAVRSGTNHNKYTLGNVTNVSTEIEGSYNRDGDLRFVTTDHPYKQKLHLNDFTMLPAFARDR